MSFPKDWLELAQVAFAVFVACYLLWERRTLIKEFIYEMRTQREAFRALYTELYEHRTGNTPPTLPALRETKVRDR